MRRRSPTGSNRATGLAYGAVSRQGCRSTGCRAAGRRRRPSRPHWRSTAAAGRTSKPEVEARVGRLFRWHIDPAPTGLWIDRIDERGRSLAAEVPASIFYHLVSALTQYLDGTADALSRG